MIDDVFGFLEMFEIEGGEGVEAEGGFVLMRIMFHDRWINYILICGFLFFCFDV